MKQLHLGLTPWQLSNDMDADSLCRQAEAAEAWGYESFWLPEGHLSGRSGIVEPMMMLAAVAARTSKIALGTTSYLLPMRHPLLAAEQVATLDQLSGGRLILGLGRGFQAPVLKAFGVKASEKRALFEQHLQTMRAAWAGEPIGDDLFLSPLPRQQPHPPLWVAAFGPKAIAQVARLGLPYLASPMETLQQLQKNQQCYREAAAAAGTEVPQINPVMRTVFISDSKSECDALRQKLQVTPRLAIKGQQADVAVDDWCLIGSAAEVAQKIERYRESLNMTHLIATRARVPGISPDLARASAEALCRLARG